MKTQNFRRRHDEFALLKADLSMEYSILYRYFSFSALQYW